MRILKQKNMRILKQKNIPELSHLIDVVVFSTDETSKRPVPHEIHESDLDGDEYFVCWDQDLGWVRILVIKSLSCRITDTLSVYKCCM